MRAARILGISLMGALVCAGFAGCEREGPAERAGEAIDEAAADVKEGAKEAADKVEETAEKIEDKVQD